MEPPTAAIDFQATLASPVDTYEEGLAFFRGGGMLGHTLRRLAEDLRRHRIDYAAIGALALNLHGYRRFTHDIDLLMTPEGLRTFRSQLVGNGYIADFPGATKKYRTAEGNVPVDIITSGEYPGDGRPKPVAFPSPEGNVVLIDGIRTLNLERLVELKLASGTSVPDRLKDLADVQEVIKVLKLGADLAHRLDESVRDEYLKLHRAVEQARTIQRDWGPTF